MRVEPALALHQALDDADQVAAHRAADAAVVHLVDLLVGLDDEVVVDADLAELVDDDGVALAVVLGEDAVEERGLAGAEIAGEHGDGDRLAGLSGMRSRSSLAFRNVMRSVEPFPAVPPYLAAGLARRGGLVPPARRSPDEGSDLQTVTS